MTGDIDLCLWPTPNGWKIAVALDEMGLPCRVSLAGIGNGDQFRPEFPAPSPNNSMPAITDPDLPGGAPVSIFEPGAILLYQARQTGLFMATTECDRIAVGQWLRWRMGGVGPMPGQTHHFLKFAPLQSPPQDIPCATDRYRREVERLYGGRTGNWRRLRRQMVRAGPGRCPGPRDIWQEQKIQSVDVIFREASACLRSSAP